MNTPETTMEVQAQAVGNITAPTSSPLPAKTLTQHDRNTLRVVDRLGLPARKWDRAKLRVLQQYGHLINVKLTGKICLVGAFDSLERVERTQEWAAGLLSRNDTDVPLQLKLGAASIVAVCAKEYGDLSMRMLEFAERSADKAENAKPKNLPPTVALQVNVSGGGTTAAPANNGNNGQALVTSPAASDPSSV